MHLQAATFDHLIHVGLMDDALKRAGSQEGACLSVSRHPDAWQSIAHIGGPQWVISASGRDLRMLDVLALTPDQTEQISKWGQSQGLIQPATHYLVDYDDGETGETYQMVFASRAEALAEADGDLHLVHEKAAWNALPGLERWAGGRAYATQAWEYLLVAYADRAGWDGLWWDENLDVPALSAPRGGVCPSALQRLNAELAPGQDITALDILTARIRARWPQLELSMHDTPNYVRISRMSLPEHMRGSGVGSEALDLINGWADTHGATLALDPEPLHGEKGSKTALRRWYARHGFVANSGRGVDHAIMHVMRRDPQLPRPDLSRSEPTAASASTDLPELGF